jgi:gamma-glutamyltranspeptidase / glutathione hydrolase
VLTSNIAPAAEFVMQGLPHGSCELSIIDEQGNACQMMHSFQSGGIPGQVVGGVVMYGSHATQGNVTSSLDQLLTPGARMRTTIGSTMVFRNGEPVLQLGSPGALHCIVPQMLSLLIDYKMAPSIAVEHVRMLPLADDGTLAIEARLSGACIEGLLRQGVRPHLLSPWDSYLGSFQMCWREAGTVGGCSDPRFVGVAKGLA